MTTNTIPPETLRLLRAKKAHKRNCNRIAKQSRKRNRPSK